MKRLYLLCILVWLSITTLWVNAASEGPVWEIESLTGEGQFVSDIQGQVLTATNRVMVKYQDEKIGRVMLVADRIRLNRITGEAIAEGSVILERQGQYWTGDRIEYNFETRQIKASSFRTGLEPFYASGKGLTLNLTNQTYAATNAVVTTDDVAEPEFRIQAKHMKLVPGKSLEAKDAVIYVGSVPVMYFPYYRRSLERHPNNWVLNPGYRSVYGPYLLTQYNWYASDQLAGGINLDYRVKRGAGLGPDFFYDLGPWGSGDLRSYYLHDEKPGTTPDGQPIKEDRQRISFTYQANLRTNLTAKVAVHEQSDIFVIRDFFESEYRKNVQPSSFLDVNQVWPNFSLDVLTRPQVNSFFETVERLPDVQLSAIRQQLGVSPFYYESQSSAGYFRYRFADPKLNDYAAFRGDSLHQIVLPLNWFGWLNVTPRVGERLTYYSEATGRGATTTDQTRAVFNTGAEFSTKLSRTWAGARNRLLEVDGLRHIFEPSVNYVFVPKPNVLPPQLPQFDSQLPSFRLLPIEYPDYNAIDSIDAQNVLRLSVRNLLQTKRKGEIDYLVNWALYTDWRLSRRIDWGLSDPRTSTRIGQTTFSDVYSDLDFKPRSWLTLTSQTRFDPSIGQWSEADHFLTLQPNNTWSMSLGHRYLRNNPLFGPDYGDNLITSVFYYRLNENWGVRVAHQFEALDGTLEEQYYSIYRDLRSWTAALTFRVLNNRNGSEDYTVGVAFSLKAFPRFGLGQDRVSPSSLLGN
ncbi:MAG: LPS assembly protein LptD [Candidatus Omnitrophica bacterium]|nr:LPS assembly protein LptD [Candidatus Omnitrophota bacterium]